MDNLKDVLEIIAAFFAIVGGIWATYKWLIGRLIKAPLIPDASSIEPKTKVGAISIDIRKNRYQSKIDQDTRRLLEGVWNGEMHQDNPPKSFFPNYGVSIKITVDDGSVSAYAVVSYRKERKWIWQKGDIADNAYFDCIGGIIDYDNQKYLFLSYKSHQKDNTKSYQKDTGPFGEIIVSIRDNNLIGRFTGLGQFKKELVWGSMSLKKTI